MEYVFLLTLFTDLAGGPQMRIEPTGSSMAECQQVLASEPKSPGLEWHCVVFKSSDNGRYLPDGLKRALKLDQPQPAKLDPIKVVPRG